MDGINVHTIIFDDDAPHITPPGPVGTWFEAYGDRVFLPPPPNIVPARTIPEEHIRDVLVGTNPGQVLTYGELASMVGSSPRGVASVLRANPVPVILPCHRVVGARSLGGFSSGIWRKAALLMWEGWNPDPRLSKRDISLLKEVEKNLGI